MPAFDPYYKWLGIPPKDQPPNHYRLLGINLFEADAAVISNAADQRMAFLKSVQTGEHVQHSQDLLNQVAQAKLCLLDAGKRRAYDATLGDRPTAFLKKDQDRSRPQPTSGPGTVPPKYAVDAGDSMRRGAPPRTLSRSPPRQSVFSRIPSWALVAVVSGALVLVVSVLLWPGTESPDPPDGDWQQERDELLAEVARLGDLVEQRNRESQDRIQGLEQERDESLADVKRLSELVKQRDRELQTLKDKTEPPPESLVANLKEGLIAYYPFNGNAKDESGNGNGSFITRAKLTNDRFGTPANAFSFLFSDNQFMEVNDATLPAGNSPRTVSLWFTDGHPQSRRSEDFSPRGLFAYGGKRAESAFYGVSLQDGELSLGKSGGGDSPTVPLTSRDWTHAVWNFDGTSAEIFINGKKAGSDNRSFNTITTGSFQIGPGWIGNIDDVRIYNRALSAEEVKALYDHESTPPDTTASKPKPSATPPEISPNKPELAAEIKKLMTREQLALGGPIVNSIDMVLVPISAGEFTMGSPQTEEGRGRDETQHPVKITKPFYLSAYEVTQAQYQKVMDDNPSSSKGATKPVENVSWDNAVEFCRKLSKVEGVEYRLPTEAEWEYACRAGATTAYSFGNDVSELGKYAWHSSNSTHPVGELKPNAWGLFDMHGNVWEWCYDWRDDYDLKVLVDPTGPVSGLYRVARGGSFLYPPRDVRAAYRNNTQPYNHYYDGGFRLARTYDLSH
jgi:formylglycine-generating enzyme required for sulfatase activity